MRRLFDILLNEKLDAGIINFLIVKSEDQLAHILTKAMANMIFRDSLVKLGMCSIYAPS